MTIDYSWNVNDIFASSEEFNDSIIECYNLIKDFKDRFFYLDTELLEVFKNVENVYIKLNRVYSYALLQFSTNNRNVGAIKNLATASKIYDQFDQVVRELKKEIKKKISIESIFSIKKSLKYSCYEKFLDDIAKENTDGNILFNQISPYTEYQKILYRPVSVGEIEQNGEKIALTYMNQLEFLMYGSSEIRKKTYNQFLNFYEDIKDSVAYLYKIVVVKYNLESVKDGFNNYAQKYFSSSCGKLYQEISSFIISKPEITQKIVDQQKMLTNSKKISYSDLYYETKPNEFIISKEKAIEIVGAIFDSFNNSWSSIFKKIITESWIDWDSKPGKRPGGFSINVYEVHPYILLNWTDDLNGLFALAHESMGAILNYQSRNVNFLNVQHSIFLTELYSQIMENEVKEYLLQNYSDNVSIRSVVRERELIRFKDNVIKTIINTEFERKSFSIHHSESIDSITLSKIYERVSKSIYEACDGFYSNKKNNVNWVKQAHVFNPFYESNYVVTYFLAKYIKKTQDHLISSRLFLKLAHNIVMKRLFQIF
ncbi:M3 family metallopeptidase [Enterococcus faecalis]|uniref:M3 family metallopeptidase n=1 Tax=Enterococcus faecalis TaxID=1351 RepID=UPI003ABD711D